MLNIFTLPLFDNGGIDDVGDGIVVYFKVPPDLTEGEYYLLIRSNLKTKTIRKGLLVTKLLVS